MLANLFATCRISTTFPWSSSIWEQVSRKLVGMRPRLHRRRYASSVYTSVAGVSPFTRNIQLERIPSCIFFLGKLYATPRTRTSPRIFTRITVLSFRVKNFQLFALSNLIAILRARKRVAARVSARLERRRSSSKKQRR